MRLSKKRLIEILTRGLNLREPEFRLEFEDDRWSGSIISPTFRGKGDLARQRKIWDVLEAELGPKPFRRVGMLLAYTPQEWNWDVPGFVEPRPRRKAS